MITLRRFGLAAALTLTAAAAPSIPAGAATTTPDSGIMEFDEGETCAPPPVGYETFIDYTVVVSGDLDGCLYADIGPGWDLGPPSGLYVEVGREVFVGSIRGGLEGTFSTVYTWTSKWDPDVETGTEVWGRCRHLIVGGSGTGGLGDVMGFLARTDTAPDASKGSYRGVVHQP